MSCKQGGKMLVLIPVVDAEIAQPCIESILMENSGAAIHRDDILIVDNTQEGLPADYYGLRVHRDKDGHNLGVARSWNVGAREVLERKLDYLVIMSASMLFGPIYNTTWADQMDTFWGVNVIEADGHSWHLIAFHRKVFEKVGLFDENFYPGYFEAIDFGYRMRMVGMEGGWTRVWINAISRGAGLHLKKIIFSATPLLDYYAKKWGGPKGEEQWELPYNNRPLDFFESRSIPDLVKEYDLKGTW